MSPVLIFTDTQKITEEKAFLNKAVPFFQSIYDAFAALNITVSIQEINSLVNWTVNGNGGQNFVQNFAVNKLLDAAAPYVLNGVQLSRDKVKDMMILPDVSAINSALQSSNSVFSYSYQGVRVDLLTLANSIISKVADSDAQIEALFTYYTKTDASAQLATDLLVVCAAMNTFEGAHNNALKIAQPQIYGNSGKNEFVAPHPLKVVNGQFVINLDYIRRFEESPNA